MIWVKHKPYILLTGILGGLILVVFAATNRVIHGYPLEYDAYVFPFLFGFASWLIVGIFLFGWFDTRNELARVEALTILDPLTGAYNRRFFDEILKKLCEKSIRDTTPISLAMLDIDHFKTVNDTYGHQCGDYVLKRLAIILKQNNRACDFICRYGGEEFAVLLPQTGLNKAVEFAERNRVIIEEEEFIWKNKQFNITVSFGVGQNKRNNSCGEIIRSLIEDADRALYDSKTQGRNRVSI